MNAMGAGLQAAWLLARGRAEGVQMLDAAGDAAATATRSFWAAALCLPAFVCLHVLDWLRNGPPAEPTHAFTADLLGYAIGWLAFCLLSHAVALRLGRGRHWPVFIALWNWCNVLQYLMLVLAAVPEVLGAPDWLSETAWLVAMGWALWLEWFTTRLALEIGAGQAAALVGLDVAIGLFLVGLTAVS